MGQNSSSPAHDPEDNAMIRNQEQYLMELDALMKERDDRLQLLKDNYNTSVEQTINDYLMDEAKLKEKYNIYV